MLVSTSARCDWIQQCPLLVQGGRGEIDCNARETEQSKYMAWSFSNSQSEQRDSKTANGRTGKRTYYSISKKQQRIVGKRTRLSVSLHGWWKYFHVLNFEPFLSQNTVLLNNNFRIQDVLGSEIKLYVQKFGLKYLVSELIERAQFSLSSFSCSSVDLGLVGKCGRAPRRKMLLAQTVRPNVWNR